MGLFAGAKKLFGGRSDVSSNARIANTSPLREFVYLDEVSLRSLLSSQKGEMTDATSKQLVAALDQETSATVGVNTLLLAKGELASRFQTSNSSTLQTSRKATVQSWFREFHAIPGLRRLEPVTGVSKVDDAKQLTTVTNPSVAVKSADLKRGELVEFRIRLAADPVFQLGTMVFEFSGMVDDYPDILGTSDAVAKLKEVQPINKVLQRLLAGLIPVRAEAIDYQVVEVGGVEYVAHRDALAGLDLQAKPLVIVGVTEHLAYWKDIRRVLFSDGEFTMLCRVSRDGLQSSWTPVKLVDLFGDFVPGLVEQINSTSLASLAPGSAQQNADPEEVRFWHALHYYSRALIKEASAPLTEEAERSIDAQIKRLQMRSATATEQREAFSSVKKIVATFASIDVTAQHDLDLRAESRRASGLALIPSLPRAMPAAAPIQKSDDTSATRRLLDVEVVAIYW